MTTQKSGILVISRHAESEWNLLGKWTGWTDVNLTEKGYREAVMLGEQLRDITFNEAYTSELKRTHQTCDGILEGKGDQIDLPRITAKELNERDYGDLTGKNKWEVKNEIGEEAFNGIRRGWDYPVPGGETLKDVYARAVPYLQTEISPRLYSVGIARQHDSCTDEIPRPNLRRWYWYGRNAVWRAACVSV